VPVLALVSGLRLDDLWTDNQLLLNHQHGSIILIEVGLISARGNGHQVVRESFDTVWTNRVRSYHHVQVVSLEE